MWLWLFAPFLIRNVIAANFDPTEFFKTRCEPKCVFEASNLNSTNIDKFPKDCSTVCTDLAIDDKCDLTEEQLTATLQNMKHLVGSLIVISVKYTSVKFLAGLESVECGDLDFLIVLNNKMFEVGMTSLNTINCSSIAIDNNKEMTKLNVPNLKYMYPSEVNKTEIKVRIDGLSKKFCVTTEEMYNLMGVPNIDLDSLEGMHCEPATPLTNGKVCNSSYTLIYPTEILDGCTQYFGSLVINSENEKDVSKLKSVEAIFGPLFIEKTNLTSIDFLTNLKFISTLGYDTTAVQVINNPFLSNFSFPSLKKIKTNGHNGVNDGVIFTNNSYTLSEDPNFCNFFWNFLGVDDWPYPEFDGKSCESIQVRYDQQPVKRSARNMGLEIMLISILLTFRL